MWWSPYTFPHRNLFSELTWLGNACKFPHECLKVSFATTSQKPSHKRTAYMGWTEVTGNLTGKNKFLRNSNKNQEWSTNHKRQHKRMKNCIVHNCETKVKKSEHEKTLWKDRNTEYLSGISCSYLFLRKDTLKFVWELCPLSFIVDICA